MNVYLFAETPRAASDHPAIVPTRNAAAEAVRNKYIPLARDGKTGKDFIAVCQSAPRTRLGKTEMSTETLVLAVPGYDLSKLQNRQQIEKKLKEYLKQIADINDWAKENRPVVPLKQFSEWQEGFAAMFPNNLPPLSPQNWNMGLKLFGVFFIVLSVVFGQRLSPPSPEPTQIVANLTKWLKDLGVESSSTDENALKEKLWNTLSQAFETKVPLTGLETTLLPNLATCLQYKKKENIELLADKAFRDEIAKLFSKRGERGKKTGTLNPFGTIQDVLENREVRQWSKITYPVFRLYSV